MVDKIHSTPSLDGILKKKEQFQYTQYHCKLWMHTRNDAKNGVEILCIFYTNMWNCVNGIISSTVIGIYIFVKQNVKPSTIH